MDGGHASVTILIKRYCYKFYNNGEIISLFLMICYRPGKKITNDNNSKNEKYEQYKIQCMMMLEKLNKNNL